MHSLAVEVQVPAAQLMGHSEPRSAWHLSSSIISKLTRIHPPSYAYTVTLRKNLTKSTSTLGVHAFTHWQWWCRCQQHNWWAARSQEGSRNLPDIRHPHQCDCWCLRVWRCPHRTRSSIPQSTGPPLRPSLGYRSSDHLEQARLKNSNEKYIIISGLQWIFRFKDHHPSLASETKIPRITCSQNNVLPNIRLLRLSPQGCSKSNFSDCST